MERIDDDHGHERMHPDMRTRYTIGQLANAAGVPTSTVRYYERVGLLQPSGRSEGNYRLYDEEDLDRLRFIRAAQATGFTIENVFEIVNHSHDNSHLCEDVQTLLETRLADVKKRMTDLRHVERVLRSALATCRKTVEPGHCVVIDRLRHAARPAPDTARPKRRKNALDLAPKCKV
jgi:MerR family mercuric resistance operon transcriptional regulator